MSEGTRIPAAGRHSWCRRLALAAMFGALASATFAVAPAAVPGGPLAAAVALADQPTVTVSSFAAEAQTEFTDTIFSNSFFGQRFTTGTDVSGDPWTGGCLGEGGPDTPDPCFPAPPASSEWWGFASINLRPNPCTATNLALDCDPPQTGWGPQGIPPTSVSLGAPFSMVTTYWWNMATVGQFPASLAVGGDVEVTPPGLAPFQFWISQPDNGLAAGIDRLAINYVETPNESPESCVFARAGDAPCDDAAILGPPDLVYPTTWTEVADGLTWHLTVLGFQDPGNPPGDYTDTVLLPELAAGLKAPIMATLTVDANPTSIALQSAASSTRYGDPVQFTATVSPAPSTAGSVAFQDGGQAIAGCAAQPVDPSTGNANCTTSSLRAGPHAITAVYSGALGFAGSPSSQFTQTVTPAPLTVNAPNATAAYGNIPSRFKATYAGLVNGDGAPATPPSCTTTASNSSEPGSYPITCSGASDPDYTISHGPAGTLTVTKAPTKLQAAPASKSLLSIRFSATLTRPDTGVPLGGKTVAFSLAGQKVCSAVTNTSGVASCKVTGVALGRGSYTASFAGDTHYVASSGTGNL